MLDVPHLAAHSDERGVGVELFGDLGLARIIAIVLITIGAGVIKGAIGFGFQLLAAPLLSIVWDARHAVPLLALTALMNNVGSVFGLMASGVASRATTRRLAPAFAGLVVGTVGGALLLAALDPTVLGAIVGGVTVAFAVVSLVNPSMAVPPRLERYLAFPIGLIGGLLSGSTSVTGPAIVSYTHALQLDTRQFILYLSLMYLVSAVVQVGAYIQLGLFDRAVLLIALVTFIPNVLRLTIGLRLQDRIDPDLFRRVVVVVIALSGLSLLARAFWP